MKNISLRAKKLIVLASAALPVAGLFVAGFFVLSSTGAALVSGALLLLLVVPAVALARSIGAQNDKPRAAYQDAAPSEGYLTAAAVPGSAEADRLGEISATLQQLAYKASATA